MSLVIVRCACPQEARGELIARLRAAVRSCGRAVLLVPSFAQALDAQRLLASQEGLALGVTASTPAAWAAERWEVWGDGRRVVDGTARDLLASRLLARAFARPGSPLSATPGTAALLADLSRLAAPWLAPGAAQGESAAERALIELVGELQDELAVRGLVEGCAVMASCPGPVTAPVVLAGFERLPRAERELASALAGRADVTLVADEGSRAARELADLARERGVDVREEASSANVEPAVPARDAELGELLASLFRADAPRVAATGALRLLAPAGPSAAPELVAREVRALADAGAREVVIASPDVASAWRDLAPRLAARGVAVRAELSRGPLELEAGRAFMGYARSVALLAELDATWPEPVAVPDAPKRGTVRVTLEDMSWWPPRALSDFLASSISHVGAGRARELDARWRSNRLLTPGAVLAQLASESVTSPEVAAATRELLRGRLGSAASKLLAPLASAASEGEATRAQGRSEAASALAAVLDVARVLKELGVVADGASEGSVTLSELVSLAASALERSRVVLRPELAPGAGEPVARATILSPTGASRLPAASADALVLLGQTSEASPVPSSDDVLSSLLVSCGVERELSPMDDARARFAATLRVPRRALVVERALKNAAGKECYPSVMLTELLACYGVDAMERELPKLAAALGEKNVLSRPETLVSENAAPAGEAPRETAREAVAPAGTISERVRDLVTPPQDGAMPTDAGPVLSASQFETYLECPYKWFSLRRLRLEDADAGFTGAEMGVFVHRVLEVTHRELLARAQERAEGGHVLADLRAERAGAMQGKGYREEVDRLVARAQADPVVRLSGSSLADPAALEEARAVLAEEFDAHLAHQHQLSRSGRSQFQALVPHTATEHGQLSTLRRTLDELLGYEAGLLPGFEPRFFEWDFGRGGAPAVEYAGVLIGGTVDRIDVDAHGQAMVIDYKHKYDRTFAREYDALPASEPDGSFRLPRHVQSLVYAQVVRRAFPDLTVRGALYLCTRGRFELSGAIDENLADVAFGERVPSPARLEHVSVPRTERFGGAGAGGIEALLDACEEAIGERMKRLRAGDIEARPLDAASCDFCPVLNCERRMRK